jgi:hypothetical protein
MAQEAEHHACLQSYSHADKSTVDRLAAHLVKLNANVWVDTWELNVGDSILNADLRTDFESGLHRILDAIAKVTNAYQGRIEEDSPVPHENPIKLQVAKVF